jgi:hypothetical protein
VGGRGLEPPTSSGVKRCWWFRSLPKTTADLDFLDFSFTGHIRSFPEVLCTQCVPAEAFSPARFTTCEFANRSLWPSCQGGAFALPHRVAEASKARAAIRHAVLVANLLVARVATRRAINEAASQIAGTMVLVIAADCHCRRHLHPESQLG